MKMEKGRTREREGMERNILMKTEAIKKRKKREDSVSEDNETSP